MEEQNELQMIRHSTAHVMAHAVKNLWPDVKIGIGPAIEDGFYYDFDKKEPFTNDDLEKIEEEMKKIVKSNSKFVRREVSKEEALEIFKDQPYKQELIRELPEDEVISVYEEGDFVDLCRGPHVNYTSKLKVFKLMNLAGAYWRGSEKNPMLTRIYATAFKTKEELEEHLTRLEEAEKRDHRRLGKDLDLFSIQEDAGAGLVFWHPKGAMLRMQIEDYWRKAHIRGGYEMVFTPHIAREHLWKVSGHLDFYSDSIYNPIDVDGENYLVKPMNCPFHLLIYKSKLRSYRDLPVRWAELGTVYRYERSGTLHGLMRVRGFTQDDAHIICRRDQAEAEVKRVLKFVIDVLSRFGFKDYQVYLSTRPEKWVGTDEGWQLATDALKAALDEMQLSYDIDEGGGAFYGPKIDVKIKDTIGRVWQCSTIQVDFAEPERFDITYIAQDNQPHRPIMIHRALLGSLERFMGVLVEHYAGAFPLWLAPVQMVVLPIADRHQEYAHQLAEKLRDEDFRVHVDDRNEKTGYKIREAQLQKIPYMLVVGDREVEENAASVRSRERGDLGAVPVAELVEQLKKELTS